MKRRWVALVSVAALAALMVPAAPALATGSHPSSDVVEVSRDGVVYHRDYSGLFDGRLLVPGGKAEDTFVVKNDGGSRGFLRVILATVDIPNRDVFHALTISAGTPDHPGRMLPVSVARPCLTLLEGQQLTPGQSVPVVSELALGDLTATAGQGVPIKFQLQILLSESDDRGEAGCPVSQSAPFEPGATLAATGFAVAASVGGIAVLLVGVGGALTVWSGRRRSKMPRRGSNGA
ncbi:MAG: hypothetical protein ACHP7F_02050 [Actinomycetales bacterium]